MHSCTTTPSHTLLMLGMCTSNFQVEYRDVDPQNTAQMGSTVFVIPKSADLLDLWI